MLELLGFEIAGVFVAVEMQRPVDDSGLKTPPGSRRDGSVYATSNRLYERIGRTSGLSSACNLLVGIGSLE